eukprot:6184216-Pleurochrysis_carterae.AAC.2
MRWDSDEQFTTRKLNKFSEEGSGKQLKTSPRERVNGGAKVAHLRILPTVQTSNSADGRQQQKEQEQEKAW